MTHRLSVFLWGLLILVMGTGWSGMTRAQKQTVDYFSQGQAVYDSNNLAKSRDEAVQDLLVHGITQALRSFLEPSQIGAQYTKLEKKLFSQPQRYVQKFQIFSETPADGLYRVRGEVTVAVDVLQRDLQRLGLISSRAHGAEKSTEAFKAEVTSDSSKSSRTKENLQEALEETPETSSEEALEENLERAFQETLEKPSKTVAERAPKESLKEIPKKPLKSRQEVLWVVSEKWETDWHLPLGNIESRSLFVATVLQESEDHNWTLVLPKKGLVDVDAMGNVPLEQAISLARNKGIETLVLGTASLEQAQEREPLLNVYLRVLDSTSGQSRGEIRQKQSTRGTFYAEKFIELAAIISVQLDRLLPEVPKRSLGDEPSSVMPSSQSLPQDSSPLPESQRSTPPESLAVDNQSPSAPSFQDVEADPTKISPKKPGQWTLIVRSDTHYRLWEELEGILREKLNNLKVESIEVDSKESRIHLEGVNSFLSEVLKGIQLRQGLKVVVNGYSPEDQEIEITFVPIENYPLGSTSP
jgi:hypothetical protein